MAEYYQMIEQWNKDGVEFKINQYSILYTNAWRDSWVTITTRATSSGVWDP